MHWPQRSMVLTRKSCWGLVLAENFCLWSEIPLSTYSKPHKWVSFNHWYHLHNLILSYIWSPKMLFNLFFQIKYVFNPKIWTQNWNSSLSQTLIKFCLQTLKMNKYSTSNLTVWIFFFLHVKWNSRLAFDFFIPFNIFQLKYQSRTTFNVQKKVDIIGLKWLYPFTF